MNYHSCTFSVDGVSNFVPWKFRLTNPAWMRFSLRYWSTIAFITYFHLHLYMICLQVYVYKMERSTNTSKVCLFVFFLTKRFHAQKAQNVNKRLSLRRFIRTKNIKSTKSQTNDFLPLRCFHCAYKCCLLHTKKHKKWIKSIKTWISDFLPLRCFLRAFKTLPFFVFLRLYAFFVLFMCVKSIREKK